MSKKLSLYSNCLLVKGASRSVICDTQQQILHYIPNSLYNLLNEQLGKSVEDIKINYSSQYDEIIDEYISFLEEKNCVFYTDSPDSFPKMSLDWHYPHKISNAILDYDSLSKYNIEKVLEELDELRCKSIQIRFFSEVDKKKILSILQFLDKIKSMITSVEIILKNSDWTTPPNIKLLFLNNLRLTSFSVHSSNKNEIIEFGSKYAVYTDQIIDSEYHCGIISKNYFSINLTTFSEAFNKNSCLNNKISVDKRGKIKNCPSMSEDFGTVGLINLKDVIEQPKFNTIWNVTKDQIHVCKDCEFRYVCTDCRAYVEQPNEINSKPLKCGYNPYTTEWSDWSKNELKTKAVEHYGLRELNNFKN
mgnify:CR=1 FL=1